MRTVEEKQPENNKAVQKKSTDSLTCNILPTDKQSLLRVSGVGASKMQKYGERFLETIHTFLDMHPNEIVSMSVEPKDKPFDRAEFNRKRNRPEGAGVSWSEEEDKTLDQEFHSGMSIAEIAKLHSRTAGGIRARLKKHGLIE